MVREEPDPWDDVRGLDAALIDAGYLVGWSNKLHLSEDRMRGKKGRYQRHGNRFNKYSQNVSAAADPNAEKAKLLDEVRSNFQDLLDDRQPGQPFFYWFNPTNTHRPWVPGSGEKLWGLDPEKLKGRLPKFLPDDPVIREDFADYLGEAMAFDAAVGVLVDQLRQSDLLDQTILVISGDHGAPGFPRGKCNLYDFGTRVSLVIRFPGRVAKERRIETPVSLIDLAPTFANLTGVKLDGSINGQDLSPSMAPEITDFESKLRGWVLTGRENHVDESRPGGLPYPSRAIRNSRFMYIINFAPDRWPVAMPPLSTMLQSDAVAQGQRNRIVQRRMDIDFGPTRDFFVRYENDSSIAQAWQLGFGLRKSEELYDIQNDPDQMTNLAGQPEYEEARNQLRDQLINELRSNDDPRVTNADSAFDHPPYTRGKANRGTIVTPN